MLENKFLGPRPQIIKKRLIGLNIIKVDISVWCKNIISWQTRGKVLVSCTNKQTKKSHFLGGSDGKASAYNAGDQGSISGSGRSPGEGNKNPLQYTCLENPRSEETEEPGGLQSMGSQRVQHDWVTSQTKENRIDIVKKWMEDVNSSHLIVLMEKWMCQSDDRKFSLTCD